MFVFSFVGVVSNGGACVYRSVGNEVRALKKYYFEGSKGKGGLLRELPVPGGGKHC